MRIALVAALTCATVALPASATTIVVDHAGNRDYENTQAGVDAAAEGDMVLVYPGTYTTAGDRDITFGDKNVVLRGANGAADTILRNTAAGSGGAINCWGSASAQFSEVTMVGNSAQGEGGSVYVQGGATPTFDNTIVAFTKQARGAAVACDGTGDPTFQY